MLNMRKTPLRGSSRPDPLKGCGIITLLGIAVALLVVLILVSSCSVPAGGGSGGSECEWEKKPNHRSTSFSLSHAVKSVEPLEAVGFSSVSRPKAPKGASGSGYKIGKVKPKPGSFPINKVKPGKTPVKMPLVKPHKPTRSPGRGYHWVYDCD